MRNGVDLSLFHPKEQKSLRGTGAAGRTKLLSVGHLIKRKGHDLIIDALAQLPDTELLIAGHGPERRRLEHQAKARGVDKRVHFLGVIEHEQLTDLYNSVDLLVLASSREGWPNVLLEALACGTPVVATRNWGTPEIISSPDAGCLVEQQTPDALVKAIRKTLLSRPDRVRTRAFAEAFSWDATTEGQVHLFSTCLGKKQVEGDTDCNVLDT